MKGAVAGGASSADCSAEIELKMVVAAVSASAEERVVTVDMSRSELFVETQKNIR